MREMADNGKEPGKYSRRGFITGTGVMLEGCQGYLVCDSSICGGCKKCEMVCSLYHEDVISPALARITVKQDIFGGYICKAMPCLQCDGPDCLLACPVPGALYVDDRTGARVIDQEKCTGCKLCLEACPTTPKGIRYNVESKVCFKCDLCDGNPQCVKFCPTGALGFVRAGEA